MNQEVLAILTSGYNRFAQMNLSTANLFGYLRNPFYLFIAKDESGEPYIIEPRVLDTGEFEFKANNERRVLKVDGDFIVQVYASAAPAPQTDEEQIDALWNFAMQYPPRSLIRQFLCEDAIAWLERNKETPSLYREYLRMRIAAQKLEDDLADLEEIYG